MQRQLHARSLGTHVKAAAFGTFRGIARDLVSAMGELSLAAAWSERLTFCFEVDVTTKDRPRHSDLAVAKSFTGQHRGVPEPNADNQVL